MTNIIVPPRAWDRHHKAAVDSLTGALMLTAVAPVIDRTAGLPLAVDDYLAKA